MIHALVQYQTRIYHIYCISSKALLCFYGGEISAEQANVENMVTQQPPDDISPVNRGAHTHRASNESDSFRPYLEILQGLQEETKEARKMTAEARQSIAKIRQEIAKLRVSVSSSHVGGTGDDAANIQSYLAPPQEEFPSISPSLAFPPGRRGSDDQVMPKKPSPPRSSPER